MGATTILSAQQANSRAYLNEMQLSTTVFPTSQVRGDLQFYHANYLWLSEGHTFKWPQLLIKNIIWFHFSKCLWGNLWLVLLWLVTNAPSVAVITNIISGYYYLEEIHSQQPIIILYRESIMQCDIADLAISRIDLLVDAFRCKLNMYTSDCSLHIFVYT